MSEMKQIKITKVDNGFIVEVTMQGQSVLKGRYDRPTIVLQDPNDGIDCLWRLIEEKLSPGDGT